MSVVEKDMWLEVTQGQRSQIGWDGPIGFIYDPKVDESCFTYKPKVIRKRFMFNSLYAILLIVIMCHGHPPTSPVTVGIFVMVDTSTHEPALGLMHVVAQRDAPIIQQFTNIGTGVTSGVHTLELPHLDEFMWFE